MVDDPGHLHGATIAEAGDHQHRNTVQPSNESGSGDPWGSGGSNRPEGSGYQFWSEAAGRHGHLASIQSARTNITLRNSLVNAAIYAAATGITLAGQGASDGRPRNMAYSLGLKL